MADDYAYRQQLLLDGIKICYEPAAIGRGEAAPNWKAARAQRMRWLRGTFDSSQRLARELLLKGLSRCEPALIDGGLQAYLPSYSTLTLVFTLLWAMNAVLWAIDVAAPFALWSIMLGLLVLYPVLALLKERAPFKAYVVLLSGPIYILWRSWLAVTSRSLSGEVKWVRTPRRVA